MHNSLSFAVLRETNKLHVSVHILRYSSILSFRKGENIFVLSTIYFSEGGWKPPHSTLGTKWFSLSDVTTQGVHLTGSPEGHTTRRSKRGCKNGCYPMHS